MGDMGVGFVGAFGSARGIAQAAQEAAIRQRVLANIAESRAARRASRFGRMIDAEARIPMSARPSARWFSEVGGSFSRFESGPVILQPIGPSCQVIAREGRKGDDVADTLVRTLGLMILDVLGDGVSQRPLAEEDHAVETLFLDRADEPLPTWMKNRRW